MLSHRTYHCTTSKISYDEIPGTALKAREMLPEPFTIPRMEAISERLAEIYPNTLPLVTQTNVCPRKTCRVACPLKDAQSI